MVSNDIKLNRCDGERGGKLKAVDGRAVIPKVVNALVKALDCTEILDIQVNISIVEQPASKRSRAFQFWEALVKFTKWGSIACCSLIAHSNV